MKKKILVVDDETSICLLLENFLSQNYDVVTINESNEALAWLEGNLPDLIISDIQMNNMDGYEFTETLREAHCEIPIIIVTAKEELEDKKT